MCPPRPRRRTTHVPLTRRRRPHPPWTFETVSATAAETEAASVVNDRADDKSAVIAKTEDD